MVRKIVNNNKQNVKQSVVVKVHIGDKRSKKGKRNPPRKRSGGGGGAAAHQYSQPYTPVYIQSGTPSPPQAEETNALLTIIKDYQHKEQLQNALHKQVGAAPIPTPAPAPQTPTPTPAPTPQTPIKTPIPIPSPRPKTPQTPNFENTYSNKTTPIIDGKNPSLLDTVKGLTPSREFIGKKSITNYTSQEDLKPVIHYNKGSVIKSTGEFNPDEEEREKITKPRKTEIPKLKKNGEPRKVRKDKGMKRGTHFAGFKNAMDTNDDE